MAAVELCSTEASPQKACCNCIMQHRKRTFPMDVSAKGLRVVVTAGGAGIGRAIAATFLEHGARVQVCDVDEGALQALGRDLPAIHRVRADVAEPAQVERLFDEAKRNLGGLDVLVNNAGIAGPTAKVED